MPEKKKENLNKQVKGVGHITVYIKVTKGKTVTTYYTRYGFAGVYTKASLQTVAAKFKEIGIDNTRREEPDADKITASNKIYTSDCQYIIPQDLNPET